MHDIDDAEGAAAEGAEDGHGGHGPQDELEVEVVGDVGAAVGLADGHGQDGVGHHPRHHHVRAHRAVVVLLLLRLRDAVLVDLEAIAEVAESFIVAAVDVELLARHFQFYRVAFARDGGAEVDVDDVVAFGAPGDVVRVAEGVDLQRADVGWQEGEVLGRGGEHVPRIEVEEGHEEVQTDGGGGGDDKVGEEVVAQFQRGRRGFELEDDDVKGGERGVGHDHRVHD